MSDPDLGGLAVLGGDLDPTTPLGEVRRYLGHRRDLGLGEDLNEMVRLMRGKEVRRIPLTENGRSVGL